MNALLIAAVASRADTTSTSVLLQVQELLAEYNCTSVYFDAGSNIGVQIRKLYEPGWYLDRPDKALNGRAFLQTLYKRSQARIMSLQDEAFGQAPRCHVCSIGFEPNPKHQPRLQHFQQRLRAALALQERVCLWCTQASPAATAPCSYREWGTSSHSADMTQTGVALSRTPASAQSVSVPTVDFATVLLGVRELLSRGGGSGDRKGGQIVMKMDLETEEYTVLPHLIRRSALCELDAVYVEWHPKLCGKNDPKVGHKALCNRTKHLRAHSRLLYDLRETVHTAMEQDCHTALHDVNDEYHATDGAPWPSKSALCERL